MLKNDLDSMIEEDFDDILLEETDYNGKGTGFNLKTIDGIILSINKYTPFLDHRILNYLTLFKIKVLQSM